jgi:hypothetical protein
MIAPRLPLPLPTVNGREDGLVPDEGTFGLKDWRRVGAAGRMVFAKGGVLAEATEGRASIAGGAFGLRACGCVGVVGCRTCADMVGRLVREGDGSSLPPVGCQALKTGYAWESQAARSAPRVVSAVWEER